MFPEHLADRFRRFKFRHFAPNQDQYEKLAGVGQAPDVMVVSCCDSRVDQLRHRDHVKLLRGPVIDLGAAILCSLLDSILHDEPERIGYLAVCDDNDMRFLLRKACYWKQHAPKNGESRNEFCLHSRWVLFWGCVRI